MFEQAFELLIYPNISLEELFGVNDGNVCTSPIMTDKVVLEFVQSSKNIDADSENETNNAALVPTSSEMRNIIKRMHNCLAMMK
ncbi:hypothetical protein TNCV_3092021 [Trichonephila clavipes]|uniref:Uncharacterized protein n=1 Tax=Trichonephila clavipes TaxID=2585209 RepID=A0A8X6S7V4_TRICX|nr:hypothetical protein TNCV_3092021 [Trichonephila clavipes]